MRLRLALAASITIATLSAAHAAPWREGRAAAALLHPWATCDELADLREELTPGERLRVRATADGVIATRDSAGSGRWATAHVTTLRLRRGQCTAVGVELDGGAAALVATLALVARGGAARPTLEEVLDLLAASVRSAEAPRLADADDPTLASARMLLTADGEPTDAGTELLGPARASQPAHPGVPRAARASAWSPQAIAAAGLALPTAETPVDAMFVWPLRAPVVRYTDARWQLSELRFDTRTGGGLLAAYDRRARQHRWLLAVDQDNRQVHGAPTRFDILAVHGDLLLVRTIFDDRETLWAIDLARGVTRAVQRAGTFRATRDGVAWRGEDGHVETLTFAALTP